jgi:hypothetical protein
MMISCPISNAIPRTLAVEAEMCIGQRTHGSTKIPDDQFDHDGSYSWLWWVNGLDKYGNRKWQDGPVDAYAALGHANNRGMIIIPSLDVVIVWNQTELDNKPSDIDPINEILKLIQDSIYHPANGSLEGLVASQIDNQLPSICENPFRLHIPLSAK